MGLYTVEEPQGNMEPLLSLSIMYCILEPNWDVFEAAGYRCWLVWRELMQGHPRLLYDSKLKNSVSRLLVL